MNSHFSRRAMERGAAEARALLSGTSTVAQVRANRAEADRRQDAEVDAELDRMHGEREAKKLRALRGH